MTLDLTQFHEIFFEENFEALDSMEAALLKLSAGEAVAEPRSGLRESDGELGSGA